MAATAGVSRSWLYRHEDLRAVIVRLRPATAGPAGPANAQRASVESIRQRLDAARDEVDQLRAENARLRDQVARRFGEHRARG